MIRNTLFIMYFLVCNAALGQTLSETQVRQLIHDEVKKQIAALREEDRAKANVESVVSALTEKSTTDGWYAIPPTTASASKNTTLRLKQSSPRSSSTNVEPSSAVVSENAFLLTNPLAGPAGVATADNPIRPNFNAVEFNTSTNGTQATITLSKEDETVAAPNSNRIHKASWSFTASAPLNKDTGEATFASLTGLADGFTLGTARTLTSAPKAGSSGTSQWSRIFNFRAETGYDDFAYYTSLTEKQTDRELRWSAGTSFATTSPKKLVYFGAGIDLQHAYKSRKPRIVCPQTSDDTFDCVQGSFGSPMAEYRRVAYLEARSKLIGRPFSLRVSHDFANDRSSVDLPIYLLRASENKFTGGVRLGWTSEDDFVAGVFIGKEFTID